MPSNPCCSSQGGNSIATSQKRILNRVKRAMRTYFAKEQCHDDNRQRPVVCSMVIRRSISRHVARYDLGCGVWRCHDRHHVAVLKKSAIFVHEPRSTEVRNDTVSFRVHQDVLRLYVMVNDAALVKIVQSEDLPRGKTHK